jgi:hypothetical protein
MSATFDADHSMHATFDLDGDGRMDAQVDELRSGGLLQSRTSTEFDDTTGSVVRRETMTVYDVDHMNFKVEELVSGVLTTVSDFDAPTLQKQVSSCYGPAPPGDDDTVPCGKTDAQLRQLVHEALENFARCLDNYGGRWTLSQFEVFLLDLTVYVRPIKCFRDPTYYGHAQLANGTLRLNNDMLTCEMESLNFVYSTIVHEMLHFSRGPHEFDSPMGHYGPRAQAYSDPMYACEELCFGTLKTRCSCARCLRTKACDSRCRGLDTCRVDAPDGSPMMSEAVGAYCEKNKTWYATMAACSAADACPKGKSGCKSYSVSCNPACQ